MDDSEVDPFLRARQQIAQAVSLTEPPKTEASWEAMRQEFEAAQNAWRVKLHSRINLNKAVGLLVGASILLAAWLLFFPANTVGLLGMLIIGGLVALAPFSEAVLFGIPDRGDFALASSADWHFNPISPIQYKAVAAMSEQDPPVAAYVKAVLSQGRELNAIEFYAIETRAEARRRAEVKAEALAAGSAARQKLAHA